MHHVLRLWVLPRDRPRRRHRRRTLPAAGARGAWVPAQGARARHGHPAAVTAARAGVPAAALCPGVGLEGTGQSRPGAAGRGHRRGVPPPRPPNPFPHKKKKDAVSSTMSPSIWATAGRTRTTMTVPDSPRWMPRGWPRSWARAPNSVPSDSSFITQPRTARAPSRTSRCSCPPSRPILAHGNGPAATATWHATMDHFGAVDCAPSDCRWRHRQFGGSGVLSYRMHG